MQVLAHPDPWRLEAELCRQVSVCQTDDPLKPILVIVPTARLAGHVRRRLAAGQTALLGVEVLHHRALAHRILDAAGIIPPQLLSPHLQDCILGEALRRAPDEPLAAQARTYAGARRRLLATFRELREAQVTPAQLEDHVQPDAVPGSDSPAVLYHHYVEILQEVQAQGRSDEAGMVALAVAAVGETTLPWPVVIHHGAGDLIGIHLDLVRTLAAGRKAIYLLPAAPGRPAWRTSEEFARQQLVEEGAEITALDDDDCGLLGPRLADLFDESVSPGAPLPGDPITLRHAQGGAAEVQAALQEALAAVGGGLPASELLIVARRLDGGDTPYGLLWEQAAAGEDLPWSSSLTISLRRDPAVRDFLRLLHANEDDFPRAAVVALLASPRLTWTSVAPDGDPPTPHQVDIWSLRAGLLGGLDDWLNLLPAATRQARWTHDEDPEARQEAEARADRDQQRAQWLGQALSGLRKRMPRGEATWGEHARVLKDLWRDLMIPENQTVNSGALAGVIEDMVTRRKLPGGDRRIGSGEMLSWLDQAVDSTTLAARPGPDTGIRILDAMQARGITARRVIVLGLQSGSFPRPTTEDPFLPDRMRHHLRAGTGLPLSVSDDDDDEDRLLFGLLAGSAGKCLSISWQRADDAGRTRMPSLALRELGRLAFGTLDMEKLGASQATPLPADPERLLRSALSRGELVSRREADLLLALAGAHSPDAEKRLAARRPDLADGMAMLAATDRFDGPGSEYDGAMGAGGHQRRLHSASSLETLGRCPLQYFFTYCLGLRDEESEPELLALSPREMGTRVHSLLEQFYGGLIREGHFSAGPQPLSRQEIAHRLQQIWQPAMEDLMGPRRTRLPGLWQGVESAWQESLVDFILGDLAGMRASGLQPTRLEEEKRAEITLSEDRQARFRGFIDRLLEGTGVRRVSDYKTGGKPAQQVKITDILKGKRLQAPLYRLLAEDHPDVEILGVGPSFVASSGPPIPGTTAEASHGLFTGFENPAQEAGFMETLGVLLDLAEGQRFPLHKNGHCGWCSFRRACRRNHPPTCEREENAPDGRAYRATLKKTARKPLLETSPDTDGDRP
jgi:ATP-dependent helicase/nuclease subunit B